MNRTMTNWPALIIARQVPADRLASLPYRRRGLCARLPEQGKMFFRRTHRNKLVKMVFKPAGLNHPRLSQCASAVLWRVLTISRGLSQGASQGRLKPVYGGDPGHSETHSAQCPIPSSSMRKIRPSGRQARGSGAPYHDLVRTIPGISCAFRPRPHLCPHRPVRAGAIFDGESAEARSALFEGLCVRGGGSAKLKRYTPGRLGPA